MIIVGEMINASRKEVAAAIRIKDAFTVKKLAADQAAAGASFIDVNAGVFVGQEKEYLTWLVSKVQSIVDVPCCIDSPDPGAIEAALAIHRGVALINSISLEKKRCDALLPVLAGTDLKIVALCMSDDGMPETVGQRFAIADKLINRLVKKNIPLENIYVDPLVQPVSTRSDYGVEFLSAIDRIMTEFPGVHTVCGLSNISFGLPNRALINHTFMSMAIAQGLDSAIVNPLDQQMMDAIMAAQALIGNDAYCSNYLEYQRKMSRP